MALAAQNPKPNFDYITLSNRLRQEYYVKYIEWQTIDQTAETFNQIDSPLIEGLLLETHYQQILEYENNIIEFVTNNQWNFAFPLNLHSFNRLLIHRLSDMYNLAHHVKDVIDIEKKNEQTNKKKKK
eukprot:974090_1